MWILFQDVLLLLEVRCTPQGWVCLVWLDLKQLQHWVSCHTQAHGSLLSKDNHGTVAEVQLHAPPGHFTGANEARAGCCSAVHLGNPKPSRLAMREAWVQVSLPAEDGWTSSKTKGLLLANFKELETQSSDSCLMHLVPGAACNRCSASRINNDLTW